MARVLMLVFKDNDAAEAVVQVIDELQDTEQPMTALEAASQAERLGSIMGASARPMVLMARPTAWCTCERSWGTHKTKRFGWTVCNNCNKASMVVVRNWMNNLVNSVMGNNLLPELRDKIKDQKETERVEVEPPTAEAAFEVTADDVISADALPPGGE